MDSQAIRNAVQSGDFATLVTELGPDELLVGHIPGHAEAGFILARFGAIQVKVTTSDGNSDREVNIHAHGDADAGHLCHVASFLAFGLQPDGTGALDWDLVNPYPSDADMAEVMDDPHGRAIVEQARVMGMILRAHHGGTIEPTGRHRHPDESPGAAPMPGIGWDGDGNLFAFGE